ncbi:TolB family protein [Sunxiuqinia elliptica]|uniref:WD40-like Beta Propeller Repeat n=1 Tax=Sunxiuqinia elliptica TaxID=655355 RepID=A0A1I2MHE9_9BACT|nr:TolB family protein [Sunxiuqinia elliptica]SFF88571.1 WD40-like Beta Propeller Repeat [Sunxiuqinia elliptica]
MKQTLLVLFALYSGITFAQSPTGIFDNNKDIGSPKLEGHATYDSSTQTYSLKGAGYNIWFGRDEFNYLYNQLEGDFILTANFAFTQNGGNPHRKVGWMVRASEEEHAPHCSAVIHGDGLTSMQWRPLKGAWMRPQLDEITAPKPNYQILQLERSGQEFIFRAAHPGEPLQTIGIQKRSELPDKLLAGLFICSHDSSILEEAKVWNVRIDQPVPNDYNPGENGWLGCRLETINVFTGHRKVVFEKADRFEAPNWMPDGTKLLFNMEGSLYTIPVEGGAPEQLNTGFANRNNNDHGISFDGKLLAISHHREGLKGGGSSVYVLPLEGGTPRLVTEKTPSYWHGWAPNNKEVVYVAMREGSSTYNIYKKNIDGGDEIALTNTQPGEHVDGCEYSPDGKYIYYNGSQSGTMQLWRMHPDGSHKEQITFDEYNDWFPHISPDGKWIAFISFPPDIEFNSHPSYKRVMLRLMPANGGAPRTIAYLYGGQGTINVPSWSPNSKHIAFVSNSKP